MSQEPKKVTLKMIAEKAGTSIGTVDRALSNRPGIHPATRERVLRAAEALGYRQGQPASPPMRKRAIRIGIVYPAEPVGFYCDIEEGVDLAARELAPHGVKVDKLCYPLQDQADQLALLTGLDTSLYDGLAINSAGYATAQFIDRTISDRFPIITFNTDAPESARLFFIGNDSLQSGKMGAELLGRYLGGKGSVTVMGNFVRVNPFSERFGGFCDVMNSDFPDITLYPCAECRSQSDVAAKNLLAALSQVPEMRGVYCTGHSSTMGAVAALKALDRKDIVLIGFDVGGGSLDALREGWCDALLFQDPFTQAHQATHLLARHILQGWLPEQSLLHVETRIVIRQNLSQYMSNRAPWESLSYMLK